MGTGRNRGNGDREEQREWGQGGRQVEVTLKCRRKGGEGRGPLRPSACRLVQGSQTEDGAEEDTGVHRVAAKALIKEAESRI